MSDIKTKSGDLRVRRTAMLIEKAFADLLRERDFQSITVQAIADRAMVNRATFYDHFTDKYQLFEQLILSMMRQTIESRLPAAFPYSHANLQLLIVTACEFVAQVDERCRQGAVPGLPAFDEKIVEYLSELLLTWLRDTRVGSHPDSLRLVANVASWAIYGAANQWRVQKHSGSARGFAVQVVPLISALMEK